MRRRIIWAGIGPKAEMNLPIRWIRLKTVNCGYIESIDDSDEVDNSKALVLQSDSFYLRTGNIPILILLF